MWYPLTEIVFHFGTSGSRQNRRRRDEAHRRAAAGRLYSFLRDELLEDVVLDRSRNPFPVGACRSATTRYMARSSTPGELIVIEVRDVGERDAVEERLHVGE